MNCQESLLYALYKRQLAAKLALVPVATHIVLMQKLCFCIVVGKQCKNVGFATRAKSKQSKALLAQGFTYCMTRARTFND